MITHQPKLEQLIAQYCPNGVEFLWINDILKRNKGTAITAGKMKELDKKDAPVKIFAWWKTFAMVNFDDLPKNDIYYQPSIIVKSRGIIEFEFYDKPFSHKNEFWSYFSENLDINIKFVYYYLKIQEPYFQNIASKMQMPQISLSDFEKIQIPIPPIEVQQEIVRILDTFTDLEVELEVELEARKSQYEYYRDEMLSFEDDEVDRKSLGEVWIFIRGNWLPKSDFTESGVGCIHYGQIYTYYGTFTDRTKSFVSLETAKKLQKIQKNDLIVTNTSENLEDVCKTVVWLWDNEIVTGGHASIFKHKENPKYLAYYTQTKSFFTEKRKLAKWTKVIEVSAKDLAKIKIPVPSLEKQQSIVSILDKFDVLINDISIGLPAELKARRQQYEYYREKLLTFKKLEK